MNSTLKKIMVLGGVFIVAVIAFLWYTGHEEETAVTYGVMEGATLPVVSLESEGYSVNVLYGYVSDMDEAYMQESLTPLGTDRSLPVRVQVNGNLIKGISYEVRSLDGGNLIEQIEVTNWEGTEEGIKTVLSIQDLIKQSTEYRLKLILTTENHGEISYYTRIVLNSNLKTTEMLQYVTEFHDATFNPGEAEKFAQNWENSSTADNETLARVDIHSSFDQLLWGALSPTQIGEMQLTILEMDETFGSFRIRYEVQADGENDRVGTYMVEEFFCLQWSAIRFYLMSYERTMVQLFEASMDTITDETIEFGAVQEADVTLSASPGEDYQVFSVGGDLWSYSKSRREAILVFSFREDGDSGFRKLRREYDIQIVSADDNGNVEFFVYGYMNRGAHEGQVGLSYYRYIKEDNALQEIFYVSSDKSYRVLKQGIDTLCYKGEDLLYILFDNNVYAVDYVGREVVVVVQNADARGLVVNEEQNAIAWQQGENLKQAGSVRILYLDTGKTNVLDAADGEYLRTQGFINQDFICSMGRISEIQAEGFETLYPQYALTITNPDGQEEVRYQSDKVYISSIAVSEGQVHLERLRKTEAGQYERMESDTLMQNSTEGMQKKTILENRKGEKRRRVWYLPLKASDESRKTLNVAAPNKILYGDDTSLNAEKHKNTEMRYYAYGTGRLKGVFEEAGDAINAIYDEMGWVTDTQGKRIWHRTAKGEESGPFAIHEDAAVTAAADRLEGCIRGILLLEGIGTEVAPLLEEGQSAEEILESLLPGSVVNLNGCTLKQVYYYLHLGTPVIVIMEDQKPLLLIGYDHYNVHVYDSLNGQTYKMGQGDATGAFEKAGNRFLGYVH